MAILLGAVSLPGDLRWTDEYDWSTVARAMDYSLTGAPIIEEAVKQAGRPVTLAGADDLAWIDDATLAGLWTLANSPNWQGTLILADSRTFPVAFREEGINAKPVVFCAPGGAREGWWQVTIKLQTV